MNRVKTRLCFAMLQAIKLSKEDQHANDKSFQFADDAFVNEDCTNPVNRN